jgi:hypothetical protein
MSNACLEAFRAVRYIPDSNWLKHRTFKSIILTALYFFSNPEAYRAPTSSTSTGFADLDELGYWQP